MIYDNIEATNQIAVLTGSSLPGTITSNTGVMLVYFVSDYITTQGGWIANYTATGSPNCSSISSYSDDYNYIDDGSGSNNYYNNSDCSWLIQPNDATSITFFFEEFDLESPSEDGNTIYDYVEIFEGSNSSGTLLGRFTGNEIPKAVTANSNSMYIQFISDYSVTSQGFSGYYTTTTTNYCSGTTTLTSQSGSLDDGSGNNDYGNNAECYWLIQPSNANSITLTFSNFDTEQDYDGVIIYDGDNIDANVLGTFTGNSMPNSVTSTGGSMLVGFVSDEIVRSSGWSATYTSTITTNIIDNISSNEFSIYPNPNNGSFNVDVYNDGVLKIYDITGNNIMYSNNLQSGSNRISLNVETGIYQVVYEIEDIKVIKKLVIK